MDFNIDRLKIDKETIRKLCDWNSLSDKEKQEFQLDKIDEIKQTLGGVYDQIRDMLSEFVDMKEDYKVLIALWIIGTYLHDSFETYPYLFLNAMRGSGKTRTLKLITHCCENGQLLASLTESVLFRSKGTMGIDEFEGVGSKEKQALRELLNAGYKKGITIRRMRKVKKKDGETQEAEEFEAYRPIIMANIWGMDEVLGDRCIQLTLEKSNSQVHTKKIEDFTTNPKIKEIKTTLNLIQCSLCNVVTKKNIVKEWNNYINSKYNTTLTTLYTYTTSNNINNTMAIKLDEFFNKIDETGIDGRHLELYFPLFIISNLLGDDCFDNILAIAKNLTSDKKNDEIMESKDVMLFDFIDRKYEHNTWINVNDLTTQFRNYIGDDVPDAERWLNAKWMGRALKRLCLIIDKRRMGRGMDVTISKTKATEKMGIFR